MQQVRRGGNINIRRGQSSIELLTYSVVFIIAFSSLLGIVILTGEKSNSSEKSVVEKAFVYKFGEQLTFVSNMGNGFSYKISLPNKVAGEEYNITIRATGLIILTLKNGDIATKQIPLPGIIYYNGNPNKEIVIEGGKELLIRKENNILKIQEVSLGEQGGS